MNDSTSKLPRTNPISEEPGPIAPSTGSQAVFWLALAIWLASGYFTAFTVPLLNSLQPSLEAGLLLYFLAPITFLLAANFAAIYPAVFRKDLKSKAIIQLGWIFSIFVALLGDLAFLWGLIRLIIMGPSMY